MFKLPTFELDLHFLNLNFLVIRSLSSILAKCSGLCVYSFKPICKCQSNYPVVVFRLFPCQSFHAVSLLRKELPDKNKCTEQFAELLLAK